MKPTRHTSPKGTKLTRGDATRQAIFDNLPGTTRELADASGRHLDTVRTAIYKMAREGAVEPSDKTVPVPGGGAPQKVWQLARYKPQVTNESPFYNAWEARKYQASVHG